MKRVLSIFLVFACCFLLPVKDSRAESKKLHPRNAQLIKMGLIPPMKFFPEVPRITPHEALTLYQKAAAIFIAVGLDVPRLPRGYLLRDYYKFDPSRLNISSQQLVVLYCG